MEQIPQDELPPFPPYYRPPRTSSRHDAGDLQDRTIHQRGSDRDHYLANTSCLRSPQPKTEQEASLPSRGDIIGDYDVANRRSYEPMTGREPPGTAFRSAWQRNNMRYEEPMHPTERKPSTTSLENSIQPMLNISVSGDQYLNKQRNKSEREESSGFHLETYVRMTLLPFLPYLDNVGNKHPNYGQYQYNKPDEQWIDIKNVQNWIRICNTNHYKHCQNNSQVISRSTSGWPLWLIDVRRSCLVSGQNVPRYVTLSYVWSRSKATSTALDNLEALLEDHAFTQKGVVLPLAVTHTIGLTRMLGETHLWVDRPCIVQNDPKSKKDQIDAMAGIYANSYLTIIAAQGQNSDAGLLGIPTVTPPRQLHTPLEYSNHYEAISAQADKLMATNWYHRGWTFQEHLFSRRKVIFHDGTVNWECHCCAWYENQSLPKTHVPCRKTPPKDNIGFHISPWPDFYRYSRLVCMYNERLLTFPEDILNAFAGISSSFEPSFDGGFICGLPQMFFDAALLWQPYHSLNRRKPMKTKEIIPSWSWVGWLGELNSESWRSAYNCLNGYSNHNNEARDGNNRDPLIWEAISWRTYSNVEWSYSKELVSPKYTISVSSNKYLEAAIKSDTDLPEPWTSIEPHSSKSKRRYQHPLAPNEVFTYPIPFPESFTVASPSFQPSFLHCSTRRCSLILGPPFINPETSKCLSCDLLSPDYTWAGVLRLNLLPCDSYKFNEFRNNCSLIQLSYGSVENLPGEAVSFDEWNSHECPRKEGLYEFVNVMWVEEREGFCERKAVGRVMRSVWEKNSVKCDVILG